MSTLIGAQERRLPPPPDAKDDRAVRSPLSHGSRSRSHVIDLAARRAGREGNRDHHPWLARAGRALERWIALTVAVVIAVWLRPDAPEHLRAPLTAAAAILVCSSLLLRAEHRHRRREAAPGAPVSRLS